MSQTLRLRPLRRDDSERVHVWIEDYLAEHLRWWSAAVDGTPWDADRVADHLTKHGLIGAHWRDLVRASESSDCFVKVACDASEALGIVSTELRTDRYLKTQVGVVSWIYVDRRFRERGIASRLLEAAEGWMTWKDVEGRELFVTAPNEAAVATYRQRGFEVVDYRMLAGPPKSDS